MQSSKPRILRASHNTAPKIVKGLIPIAAYAHPNFRASWGPRLASLFMSNRLYCLCYRI